MPGGYLRQWEPMVKAPQFALASHYQEQIREGADVEVWANDRYQCIVNTQVNSAGDTVKHLSIHLHDRGPMRNWRHLQQIKNETCGELWTGVEIFPPENLLTDTANEYHLFCFPPDVSFGVGLSEDSVVTDDEMAEAYTEDPTHKGRQEPWEPGLTTGRTEHSAPARERLRQFSGERYGYGKEGGNPDDT